jgi:hypothetical protein
MLHEDHTEHPQFSQKQLNIQIIGTTNKIQSL